MTTHDSLSDQLAGAFAGTPATLEEPPQAEAQPEPEAEQPPAEAKPEPEATETPVAETQETAEPESEEGKPMVPLDALHAERNKRQDQANEIELLKRQLAAAQQQQSQPVTTPEPAPEPDWDDLALDQKAYTDALTEKVMGGFRKELDAYKQQMAQQAAAERLRVSEMSVRTQHEDYDEKVRAFQVAAQANPNLMEQMRSHPDPAKFAYDTGRDALFLQQAGQAGGLTAYVEQLMAENMSKQVTAMNETVQAKRAPEAPPPSIVNAPSPANAAPAAFDPLADIEAKSPYA